MVEKTNLPNLDLKILKDVEKTSNIETAPIRFKEDIDTYLIQAAKDIKKYERESERIRNMEEKPKTKKTRKKASKKEAPKSRKTSSATSSKIKSKPEEKPAVKKEVTKYNQKQKKVLDLYNHCMANVNLEKDLKSPVKWAGGKNNFFHKYEDLFRTYYEKGGKYIEPFLGSGSCLFGLAPEKALAGDINYELVNFYSVVKFNLKELLLEMAEYENTKNFFYRIRSLDREESYFDLDPIKKAARFYYINHMGFNGLYRVNKSGQNNVPYGYRTGAFEPDVRTLVAINVYLNKNNIEIKAAGFRETLRNAKSGDLVYLDPPMYDNSFRDNRDYFLSKDFEVLKLECDILTMNKVDFIMTSGESRFIRELFYNYNINTYEARRSISAKGSKRKGYDDLIITNF